MENKEARIESVPFDGGRRIYTSTYTPTYTLAELFGSVWMGARQPPRDEEESIHD